MALTNQLPNIHDAEMHQLLHDLFSDSSSDNDERSVNEPNVSRVPASLSLSNDAKVLLHSAIPGLVHVQRFLSFEDQTTLLARIEAEGWWSVAQSNQVMRFGSLPTWADELAALVPKSLLPPQVASRQPLFDQIIVNLYRPGEGITPHVDLLRFEDAVCSVSLGGPAVMRFAPHPGPGSAAAVPASAAAAGACSTDSCWAAVAPEEAAPPGAVKGPSGDALPGPLQQPQPQHEHAAATAGEGATVLVEPQGPDRLTGGVTGPAPHRAPTALVATALPTSAQCLRQQQQHPPKSNPPASEVRQGWADHRHAVLLLPGDLLLLHGDARYCWCHGIDAVSEEVVSASDSRLIVRGRRVSVTLRKLCTGIVLNQQGL